MDLLIVSGLSGERNLTTDRGITMLDYGTIKIYCYNQNKTDCVKLNIKVYLTTSQKSKRKSI